MSARERRVRVNGFVFYPRRYCVDFENPADRYVEGVTRGGRSLRVHIHPTEEARAAASRSLATTVPDLARFAQTGRRAKNPCLADSHNSHSNPCGVLLFEQVFAIDRPRDIWGARWASVLRSYPDDPRPALGLGYLEINVARRLTSEALEAHAQYQAIEASLSRGQHPSPVEAEEELSRLRSEVLGCQSKRFTAVIVRPQETVYLPSVSPESLASALQAPLQRYTRSGMYGGALVRVRRGHIVDSVASCQVEMGYDAARGEVRSFDEVFANFLRYQAKPVLAAARRSPDVSVEILPCLRINAAKLGNDRYGRELTDWRFGIPRIVKTYVDRAQQRTLLLDLRKSKGQRLAHVAARVARIEEGGSAGNLILSALHAYSAPFAHPHEISPEGVAGYEFDFNASPEAA